MWVFGVAHGHYAEGIFGDGHSYIWDITKRVRLVLVLAKFGQRKSGFNRLPPLGTACHRLGGNFSLHLFLLSIWVALQRRITTFSHYCAMIPKTLQRFSGVSGRVVFLLLLQTAVLSPAL